MNAGGHPMFIKTVGGTGTGNQVTEGTTSGQGTQSGGTIEWVTTGVSPGTYYYNCQYHGGMEGQIIVQANNTAGQSGDDITITGTVGDIFVFDVNAGGHPFRLKTVAGTNDATTNEVTTGYIGGDGFDHNSSQSIDIGVDEFKSFANETFNAGETYTLSGDDISGTGLTFNTTSGVLSGTVTSSYQDTFYNITVTEDSSTEARNYNFHTVGTGVIITIGDQPSDVTIEAGAGTNAQFGPINASISDSSTINYQWQYSTGGAWTSISSLGGHSGETSDTLTVDDQYAFNGWQYRCVCSANSAGSDTTTNAATLTVNRVITISGQPTPQSAVAPAAATFTITAATADTATLGYAWDKSEDNTVWHQIAGATSSSYVTTATTYDSGGTPPASFNADNGDYFRCRVSVVGGNEVTSSSVQLTVTRTLSVDTHPQNTTGSVGGTRDFSVVASISDGDSSDINYLWQVSLNDGADWSSIGGATSANYTTPTLSNQYDEYQYRCLISAAGASNIFSNAATLQVETVTVSVVGNPADRTIDEGQSTGFTAVGSVQNQEITSLLNSSFGVGNWVTPSAGGNSATEQTAADPELYNSIYSDHAPSVTYQWERSDNGGVDWNDVPGATSPTYNTGTVTYADDNGDRYRCKLSAIGATSDATTDAALLTVYRTHQVSVQPVNATGNEGGTSSYTAGGTTSSGTHTFQWSKSDNGVDYNTIPGATNATYTTPALVFADDNDDRFKCTLSLVGAETTLDTTYAVQTVLRVITISGQPQAQTIIEGQTATYSITAAITSGSLNYQWQRSQDSGGNWSTLVGATASSYTTPAMPFPTVNNQYRCVLSNSNAISITSDAANLTVNESEFVEAAASMTVNVDPTTNLTFNRQPTFTSGAFVSQYAGSAHAASYWLIKRTADNVTVYDTATITVPDLSGGDTGNLTTFTVPAGTLDFQVTYSVQVKFKDNAGLLSNYSTPVTFSTPVVDQPEIQTITPAFNPTINVLTPEIKTGYGHNSTDWQFSAAETFTDIEHQSLGNSTNLQSYTLPGDVTLLPTTTYYVRVRFNVDTI